jgi:hypothetical protein
MNQPVRRISLEADYFWENISVHDKLQTNDVHEIARQIFQNMDSEGSQFLADRGGLPVWHMLSVEANSMNEQERKLLIDDICMIGIHYLNQCLIYQLFDKIDSEFRFFLEHITLMHLILQYDPTYDRTPDV